MKYIYNMLSSGKTMLVLLFVFFVAIGTATFVENDFGNDAARKLVYNALWFEILLGLGSINLLLMTLKYKLYRKGKLAVLLFHWAFIIILIGAGITRYFGREGMMHIREGDTARTFLTTNTYIKIRTPDTKHAFHVLFSNLPMNRFKKSIHINDEKVKLKLKEYFPRATKKLIMSDTGRPIIHFVVATNQGRRSLYLSQGDKSDWPFIVYDSLSTEKFATKVYDKNGAVYFLSPYDVVRMSMADQTTDTLKANIEHMLLPLSLHRFGGQNIVMKQFMPSAQLAPADAPIANENDRFPSALIIEACTDNGETHNLTVWGQKDAMGEETPFKIDGKKAYISYGARKMYLPFQLKLNDFIIERYPGSESPSWYESNVQLIDKEKEINSTHRIYMNHILKHRGYRFYQSSYDMDEKGTVLAVNKDWLGTTVSYLGYLLMALGMVLSLIGKKSRFTALLKSTTKQKKILLLLPIIALGSSSLLYSNIDEGKVIAQPHAEIFSKLLVQDHQGRIKPMQSLASEIIRKTHRANTFEGLSPEQVFLGMMTYPKHWQQLEMIRVSHPKIREILGIDGKYASFNDFFVSDVYHGYVLKPYVEEAYKKKPAYRNKFDNEVMRTDERMNISYLVYTGSLMKLFPKPKDPNNTWYTPSNAKANFNSEDSVFVKSILNYYIMELRKSVEETQNYHLPDELVASIRIFQEKYGGEVAPSNLKIKAEIAYNKYDIFKRLSSIYLLIGLILLILQFLGIFFPKINVKKANVPGLILVLVAFAAHTFGLGMRWYVAGHAPWSNGYEALTFIAWATVLAGIVFYKRSEVALSSTAVLASLILMTAHLSWMDPQVTTLVPVLKSYWLVIHVAIITASYGFLALGALLAAVNILLMFFENKKNSSVVKANVNHLTKIIEMTLVIGLYMLTIGTFLGGIWANESWGRYWAWDPKETWALATVLLYAIVLHLRLVPGLKGKLLFNAASYWSLSSVIMTYFGVNYYLSGLHSYAAGDPVPIPPIVYYAVSISLIVTLAAMYNQRVLNKKPYKND